MSPCKLTYFVHLYFADHAKDSTFGLQSDSFSKLRDPFGSGIHHFNTVFKSRTNKIKI